LDRIVEQQTKDVQGWRSEMYTPGYGFIGNNYSQVSRQPDLPPYYAEATLNPTVVLPQVPSICVDHPPAFSYPSSEGHNHIQDDVSEHEFVTSHLYDQISTISGSQHHLSPQTPNLLFGRRRNLSTGDLLLFTENGESHVKPNPHLYVLPRLHTCHAVDALKENPHESQHPGMEQDSAIPGFGCEQCGRKLKSKSGLK
jgi:hypothetical protein